jgi:hypothetical protein
MLVTCWKCWLNRKIRWELDCWMKTMLMLMMGETFWGVVEGFIWNPWVSAIGALYIFDFQRALLGWNVIGQWVFYLVLSRRHSLCCLLAEHKEIEIDKGKKILRFPRRVENIQTSWLHSCWWIQPSLCLPRIRSWRSRGGRICFLLVYPFGYHHHICQRSPTVSLDLFSAIYSSSRLLFWRICVRGGKITEGS